MKTKSVKYLIALLLALTLHASMAQSLFMTRNGQISFFSKTPMENIDAINNEATSILNTENGDLVYAVLVKSFRFEKALMEEHFNENYMESTKFPKASFSGRITNLAEIDFSKDGKYPAHVEGDLTIHGVKKRISVTGTLEIAANKIEVSSNFQVRPEDYNIEIPKLVADKIAEVIEVHVNCQYEPKK